MTKLKRRDENLVVLQQPSIVVHNSVLKGISGTESHLLSKQMNLASETLAVAPEEDFNVDDLVEELASWDPENRLNDDADVSKSETTETAQVNKRSSFGRYDITLSDSSHSGRISDSLSDSSDFAPPLLSMCRSTVNILIPPIAHHGHSKIDSDRPIEIMAETSLITECHAMECKENATIAVTDMNDSTQVDPRIRKRRRDETGISFSMEQDLEEGFPTSINRNNRLFNEQQKLSEPLVSSKSVSAKKKSGARSKKSVKSSSSSSSPLTSFLFKKKENRDHEVDHLGSAEGKRHPGLVKTIGSSQNSLAARIQRLASCIETDLNNEMLFVGIVVEAKGSSTSSPSKQSLSLVDGKIHEDADQIGTITEDRSLSSCSDFSECSVVDLSVCSPIAVQFKSTLSPLENESLTKTFEIPLEQSWNEPSTADGFVPPIEIEKVEECVQLQIASYRNSIENKEERDRFINGTTYKHQTCMKPSSQFVSLVPPIFYQSDACWICAANRLSQIFLVSGLQRYFQVLDFHNAFLVAALSNLRERLKHSNNNVSQYGHQIASLIAQEIVGICSILSQRRDLDIAVGLLKRSEILWGEMGNTTMPDSSVYSRSVCDDLAMIPVGFMKQIGYRVHEFLVRYQMKFARDNF